MKEKWISLIIAFLISAAVIPFYPEEVNVETDNQEIIFSTDFENDNMGY